MHAQLHAGWAQGGQQVVGMASIMAGKTMLSNNCSPARSSCVSVKARAALPGIDKVQAGASCRAARRAVAMACSCATLASAGATGA
jgi:hypothetical protein